MAQSRSTEIISMIGWIRTSRLSMKNSLSNGRKSSACPPPSRSLRGLPGFLPEDQGPYDSYPDYSRADSCPWSPLPPRWDCPGPCPHPPRCALSGDHPTSLSLGPSHSGYAYTGRVARQVSCSIAAVTCPQTLRSRVTQLSPGL